MKNCCGKTKRFVWNSFQEGQKDVLLSIRTFSILSRKTPREMAKCVSHWKKDQTGSEMYLAKIFYYIFLDGTYVHI